MIPNANLCMKTAISEVSAQINMNKHQNQASFFISSRSGSINENNILVMRTPNVGNTHPYTQEAIIPIITLANGLL